MPSKMFVDTIKLNEFSNQRFLYGNFLPALYGVLLFVCLLMNVFIFTSDLFPFVTFLTFVSLVFAFIFHRLSRIALYYLCGATNLYESFISNEYDLNGLLTNFRKEMNENLDSSLTDPKIKKLFVDALLNDFKKCYFKNFYRPSTSLEMEELRRYETIFLFCTWGFLWIIINLFSSFAFYREIIVDILVFSNSVSLDVYILIAFLNILLLIFCGSFWYISRVAIRNNLLTALPLYLKPIDPHTKSIVKAINNIQEKLQASHIYTQFPGELEYEIRSWIRIKFNEELTHFRLEAELKDKLTKNQAKILVKSADDLRRAVVEVYRPSSLRKNRLDLIRPLVFIMLALILLATFYHATFLVSSDRSLDWVINNISLFITTIEIPGGIFLLFTLLFIWQFVYLPRKHGGFKR